jgi:hypothetical protein
MSQPSAPRYGQKLGRAVAPIPAAALPQPAREEATTTVTPSRESRTEGVEPTVTTGLSTQTVLFRAKPGKEMRVRIEGTSSVHAWQVEGPIIGGFLEVGPGFPIQPDQVVTPGRMDATAEVKIPVNSLKSVDNTGKPYSDKMDEIMLGKLRSSSNSFIRFHLSELVLKEAAKTEDPPYHFDASGELTVAGVTRKITMPVSIRPLPNQGLKVVGSISIKMSDYQVEPPVLAGFLTTDDEVKILFNWPVVPKP